MSPAQDFAMRAAALGSPVARLEQCQLLWQGGFAQKAIQTLKSTLEDKSFEIFNPAAKHPSTRTHSSAQTGPDNLLLAKTKLRLAKWIDLSGTQKAVAIRSQYAEVARICSRSDKGHYYLGCHYNKLLESEANTPEEEQSVNVQSGDTAKLVIDNYLRSMMYGPKYLYRTVPKVFTLWLDFGHDMHTRRERMTRLTKKRQQDLTSLLLLKERTLKGMHMQLKKYLLERIQPYVIYTAFAQMLSRIDHPEPEVADLLNKVLARVACRHPRQSLWSVLAVARSGHVEKKASANKLLSILKGTKSNTYDLRSILLSGEMLTSLLLGVCTKPIDAKGYMSLSVDIGFRKSLDFAYELVIPFQKTLIARLPTVADGQHVRKNNPFPHEGITVAGFLDDALVLSSIQKPKKLIMRGSDGEKYPILCKPKDDLRKDARLMEFNSMIDRALKRDLEANKRRLYIQTYAVTTLNDEHGVLEWIEGLKPLRDIIVSYLSKAGIKLNYGELRMLLDKGCELLAQDPEAGGAVFTKQILPKFPPVLYKWFTESFPEPDAWFNARLRYTRSCAVTSIVGYALGLGDRHGENITVEQTAGGLFHVDFNCLFEKGLTFEKPEKVPFRLTHNMVDAMGLYGYEGPFRVAAEITQRTLKQYEETLMTIMESFIHDPTTDFGLERRRRVANVPDTPEEVLESVKKKLNCMVHGEVAPLGVEGFVDMLIQQAADPKNLLQMYVGWCAYL
jgi:serine/threonine-protein kinase ATR